MKKKLTKKQNVKNWKKGLKTKKANDVANPSLRKGTIIT